MKSLCSGTTAVLVLAFALAAVGCKDAPPPEPLTIEVPPEPTTTDLATIRYHTGDVEEWPDYQFPLEHTFELPDVPAEIVGPFSADDIPADE